MGTQCKTADHGGAYVGVCHLCRISFHRVGADLTLSMKGWVAQYSLIRECCFTILCTPEWWQEKTPMKQEQGMPGSSSEFTTDVKPVSYAHPLAREVAGSRVVQFGDGMAAPQRQQEACCLLPLRHTVPLTPALRRSGHGGCWSKLHCGWQGASGTHGPSEERC